VKYILVLFCIGCFFSEICAQNTLRTAFSNVQYNYFLGRIVKHTDNFKPEITENTQLHELSFSFFSSGKKAWHQAHGQPNLNLNLIYAQYGSTKPYNRFTNPVNNAIGSHLNLTVKIDFGYAYELSEQFRLFMMLSVKHHSNGRVETPNKGLNVLGGQIGLGYNTREHNHENLRKEKLENYINKKHQIAFSVGYGRHELVKEYNGPKYPVYVAGIFGKKRLNTLLMLTYGIEYVYFKSAYHAIIDNAIVPDKPNWHASKISPYAGIEILYGRFSIAALIGYYPYKPILTVGRIPTKFGFKYYLHSNDDFHKSNFFIAGYLKTHFAVAEYLELAVGWKLGFKR